MGTKTDHAVVRVPAGWLWAVRIGGVALGVGAGFGVAPLVGWLLGAVGEAPGPLRLAALLPTEWSVPVLAVVGAACGVWVAASWRKESPLVLVDAERVEIHRLASAVRVGRAELGAALTDGRDLVLLDHDGVELARVPAGDLPTGRLRAAFDGFGHRWRGSADPRAFVRWVDHSPDLDEPAHALLRTRQRALTDKRAGAAAEALDALRAVGVSVRDRRGAQEYHRASR